MNITKVEKLNRVREEITAYLKDLGYSIPMAAAHSADIENTFHLKFGLEDKEEELEDPWFTGELKFPFTEEDENQITEMDTLPNRVTELEHRLNHAYYFPSLDKFQTMEEFLIGSDEVNADSISYCVSEIEVLRNILNELVSLNEERYSNVQQDLQQIKMDLSYLIQDYAAFKKSLEPQKQRVSFKDSWMILLNPVRLN